MTKLSHLDEHGRARMVDVSDKDVTSRTRRSWNHSHCVRRHSRLFWKTRSTRAMFSQLRAWLESWLPKDPGADPHVPSAGHHLSEIEVTPKNKPPRVEIEATVRVSGKTGVEMEAMTQFLSPVSRSTICAKRSTARCPSAKSGLSKKRRKERDICSEGIGKKKSRLE